MMSLLITDRSNLPAYVTSYDVLKTLAIVLMIIDHIGAFFFPENQLLRLIGRFCVPIWFFLIGYASTQHISPRLIVAALVVALSSIVAGMPFVPLNILVSVLFVRCVLDPFMMKVSASKYDAFMGAVCLLAVYIPSAFLFEYGTIGLALAVLGYVARHRNSYKLNFENKALLVIFIASFFVITQFIHFNFTVDQALVLIGVVIVTCAWLLQFKPHVMPVTHFMNRAPVRQVVMLCGRYSLEIYVLHIVLFRCLSTYLGVYNTQWFNFLWAL